MAAPEAQRSTSPVRSWGSTGEEDAKRLELNAEKLNEAALKSGQSQPAPSCSEHYVGLQDAACAESGARQNPCYPCEIAPPSCLRCLRCVKPRNRLDLAVLSAGLSPRKQLQRGCSVQVESKTVVGHWGVQRFTGCFGRCSLCSG